MVGRIATSLGLPHAILTWEGSGEGRSALQARARVARYDLMAAYCHEHDVPALATAHTLDDQAETFLMRLKRGSGLDGLAAIPETGAWAGSLCIGLCSTAQGAAHRRACGRASCFVTDPSNGRSTLRTCAGEGKPRARSMRSVSRKRRWRFRRVA